MFCMVLQFNKIKKWTRFVSIFWGTDQFYREAFVLSKMVTILPPFVATCHITEKYSLFFSFLRAPDFFFLLMKGVFFYRALLSLNRMVGLRWDSYARGIAS